MKTVSTHTALILTVILAPLVLLSGCTTFVDATTSGPIQQDPGKRTFGEFIDDEKLETIIAVNLKKTAPGLEQSHINVVSFNGVVLLTGEVPSRELRELAGKTARSAHGVRQVHNELLIQSNSTFFSRTNDNWLHTKVRTRLLADKAIESERVKLVVENRIVYLMGLLSQEETQRVTEIVTNTAGVEKVVRAIEYIEPPATASSDVDL